jgi:hypothetical protein
VEFHDHRGRGGRRPQNELGNYPRFLVAGADGNLVFRLLNDDADRTLAVSKGFVLIGIVKQIGGDTTCEPLVGG